VGGWAAAAETYKRLLDERFAVNGEWKFLRDFTAEELVAAAEDRRTQASRLGHRADQLERLAGVLGEHGVETVRDLPVDAALGVLS
jgi:hypothetical protein